MFTGVAYIVNNKYNCLIWKSKETDDPELQR